MWPTDAHRRLLAGIAILLLLRLGARATWGNAGETPPASAAAGRPPSFDPAVLLRETAKLSRRRGTLRPILARNPFRLASHAGIATILGPSPPVSETTFLSGREAGDGPSPRPTLAGIAADSAMGVTVILVTPDGTVVLLPLGLSTGRYTFNAYVTAP